MSESADDTMTRTLYRYPASVLRSDYLRTLAGLGVFGTIAIVNADHPATLALFGGLALLFLLYGLRTFWRQGLFLTVDGQGVTLHQGWSILAWTLSIRWTEVRQVKLRYYAARGRKERQPHAGLMTLTLQAPKARIPIESTLTDFTELAIAIAHNSEGHREAMDAVSLENFAALGYSAPEGYGEDAPAS